MQTCFSAKTGLILFCGRGDFMDGCLLCVRDAELLSGANTLCKIMCVYTYVGALTPAAKRGLEVRRIPLLQSEGVCSTPRAMSFLREGKVPKQFQGVNLTPRNLIPQNGLGYVNLVHNELKTFSSACLKDFDMNIAS